MPSFYEDFVLLITRAYWQVSLRCRCAAVGLLVHQSVSQSVGRSVGHTDNYITLRDIRTIRTVLYVLKCMPQHTTNRCSYVMHCFGLGHIWFAVLFSTGSLPGTADHNRKQRTIQGYNVGTAVQYCRWEKQYHRAGTTLASHSAYCVQNNSSNKRHISVFYTLLWTIN